MSDIINTSFLSGVFPKRLKLARVIPIFKKGEKHLLTNYRPISLLPVFSKIIEKCLQVRIQKFFIRNSIFCNTQFGFLPGRSTADAVSHVVENIFHCLNSKEISITIFIDFKKAFDSIDHGILLTKLKMLGIRGITHDLITSYLYDREQEIVIGKCVSGKKIVNSGIPQGSVLGPLLFITFINDLPNVSTLFSTVCFADDTTLLFHDQNPEHLIAKCNSGLSIFYRWSQLNRMTVNCDKTYLSVTSNRNFELPFGEVRLANSPILEVNSCRFLGVILDSKLRFVDHIDHVCSKVSKCIGILYRLRPLLSLKCLVNLYYALIYPHLDYCVTIWGNTYTTHLDRLVILQKRVLRIICNERALSHTTPLFNKCSILKLRDLIKFRVACHVYKNFESFNLRPSHNYSTRHSVSQNLNSAFQRLTLTQHSISYRGPKVWNEVPENIKSLPRFTQFRKKYRSFLLSSYVN